MFYYFEDGTKFTSKIEALSYAHKITQKPLFYYHDHIYETIDWTMEPTHSLDYYYKEQALRIRNEYDYVFLAYSGGYDSTNILETFHFNDIKLDKILIVGAFSQDNAYGDDSNHNGELYYNAFPYVKELGLESITQILDYTKLFDDVKNFSVSNYKESWVDQLGAWFSPHNWLWRDIGIHVVPNEWRGKRVALVFGKDKPTLFSSDSNGSLDGFQFRDTPCTSYADMGQQEDIKRINFYWDPEFPDILLKQLHVMKRVYSINSIDSYIDEADTLKLKQADVNKIVYDLKKPLIYKSPKSKTNILSLRDSYLKQKQRSDVFSLYQSGINKIDREVLEVVPEVVGGSESAYYSVGYAELVPVLIEAIKEQDDKISRLEALVETLINKLGEK